MPLPEWMRNYPGAPQPQDHTAAAEEQQVGIRQCGCADGCDTCDNTGVIYP
jgi:hypothetical protein